MLLLGEISILCSASAGRRLFQRCYRTENIFFLHLELRTEYISSPAWGGKLVLRRKVGNVVMTKCSIHFCIRQQFPWTTLTTPEEVISVLNFTPWATQLDFPSLTISSGGALWFCYSNTIKSRCKTLCPFDFALKHFLWNATFIAFGSIYSRILLKSERKTFRCECKILAWFLSVRWIWKYSQ